MQRVSVEWGHYQPDQAMQAAITTLNQHSVEQLIQALPPAARHKGTSARFDYRLFSTQPVQDITNVHVLLAGFAEEAKAPDTGIKAAIANQFAQAIGDHSAVIFVGGLVGFTASERRQLRRGQHHALQVLADETARLLFELLPAVRSISVAGYSMGGSLAPFVARSIVTANPAVTLQHVGCGEPVYDDQAMSVKHLIGRFSRSSNYRNQQIASSNIAPYIAIKQVRDATISRLLYRAQRYWPLLWHLPSMRYIIRALAEPVEDSSTEAFRAVLGQLADLKVPLYLLRAQHSTVCDEQSFSQLVDYLAANKAARLAVITITGPEADHGIEEQRSLSTPLLVAPQSYFA